MRKLLTAAMVLALGVASASAQSLEDLNVQIHGYATQGFLYTTQNNILTTNSSSGSASWTEAVVNVGAQPMPKLRIAVQARYFLLGTLGNQITLDYASADYKASDKFGIRFGKVKIPSGLFNEVQDIDPAYPWALLPQAAYDITSRNSTLSAYGGVVYGTTALPSHLGKLEYRGWGGESVTPSDDGYFIGFKDGGLTLPNGISQAQMGTTLRWKLPVTGLMVGASEARDAGGPQQLTISTPGGPISGTFLVKGFYVPRYFGIYEHGKFMFAAEYNRLAPLAYVEIPIAPASRVKVDYRAWYVMGTYKVNDKLTAGIYQDQFFNRQAALGPARYSKDWTISGRYDFNQYLYAKAEEHFIKGTASSYDTVQNPGGFKPNTKMTVLKLGVSF